MNVPKFRYQAIFKFDDENEVVFVGSTNLTPVNLYLALCKRVDLMQNGVESNCVNFIYQPFNKEN